MNDIMAMKLVSDLDKTDKKSTRDGFGQGLLEAANHNKSLVGLCTDLKESVKMDAFADAHPDRFFDVGVAEQNLVTVAAGLAAMGKRPFAAGYAAFCPGRAWEQIRTTICLNDRPVTIVGSHAGVSVGPDGATHQMLEDIAMMRVLPNMIVVAPADSIEAQKATLALAGINKPSYLRLAREKTPIFTTTDTPFEIGKAYVLWAGQSATLISTGTVTYNCLQAAKELQSKGVSVEVVHVPTIKPLDKATILGSVRKTGKVITIEEAQISGGLGGAIAELLADQQPLPLKRLGINDRFGESGEAEELLDFFGLSGGKIAKSVMDFI